MASWGKSPLGREGDAHSKSCRRSENVGKESNTQITATGSFVLFVYVVIASVPERLQLVSVTNYGVCTMCITYRTVFPA